MRFATSKNESKFTSSSSFLKGEQNKKECINTQKLQKSNWMDFPKVRDEN